MAVGVDDDDDDDDLPSITGEWLKDDKTPCDPDTPVEQRFLLQLRDNPDDLAMRMVFADWLEERGQPNKARVVRLLAEPPAEATHGAYELRVASSHLDGDWLAIVSRAQIEKCPAPVQVKFELRCPLSWDMLTTTDAPKVRHCARCDRTVHFCASLAEVRAHGRAYRCVALSPVLIRTTALAEYGTGALADADDTGSYWVGEVDLDPPMLDTDPDD